MTTTDITPANPAQSSALGFIVAFLLALFAALALPIYADSESVLSTGGAEELGPFAVLAALVVGCALGGRRSPLLAGISAGIIALISIAFALTTTVVLLLASLLSDFAQYEFSGGMWAIVAASVLGFIAVILSGQGWRGMSPQAWTPAAVIGAIACVAMIVGLAIPRDRYTLSSTLGFDAHPVVGIAFTTFLVLLALVGVAGFAFGRWGIGLLGGLIGYILIGWATSGSQDQSTAFGWSGVTGSVTFHPVTVIGFWTATALFLIHAVQQLSTKVAAGDIALTGPSTDRPVSAAAQWAPDPYGHGVHRYWDGHQWTTKVSDPASNVHDAPTILRPPVGGQPEWYPDPLARHQYRYFDGSTWTARVANAGIAATDAPSAPPPAVPVPPATPVPHAAPAPPTGGILAPIYAVPAVGLGSVVTVAPAPVILQSTGPSIRLSNGETRQVENTLIIGRSPAAPVGIPDGELVQVNDITVSKTHAAVGRIGSTLWVRDLNSSNGVTIDDGTGERRIAPQADAALSPGDLVVLGDKTHFVVVEVDRPDMTVPRSSLPGPR